MKNLFRYFKPYSRLLILTFLVKTIGTLMDLVIPWTLGKILDDVAPTCSADHLLPIFKWGGFMLFCALTAYISSVSANHWSAKIAKNIVGTLRKDAFAHILTLSSTQTDRFTVSSLVSRMSSDTYNIHTMIVQCLRAGLRAPILLVGGVIITCTIQPVLSLSLAAMLPAIAGIVYFVSKKGVRLVTERQERVDDMVKVARDNFTGIRVIKALSKTEFEKERFYRVVCELSEAGQKAGVTLASTKPVISMFLNFGMTAVILLGAFLVGQNRAMPGQIISFMSYFTIILNATITITRIFTVITNGVASAERIREVMDTTCDLPLIDTAAEEDSPYLIEFRNVTFSYNKTAIPTVENISFGLKKGETLGIIGGTGAGKTTLIYLLLRFYDADSGKILIEGRDIRSIPFDRLHKLFGVALQNDFIMADSISENIRFARSINEKEIKKAADCAQARDFIAEKEEGFNYPLTAKGTNLSGGQKQRILVSRAVAGAPRILILDDSSSALDYMTDANLRNAIHTQYGDTTAVIVAQRISSIRNADHILVLEHGVPVGYGTDASLSKSCEIYREIANSQMGEFDA